MRIVFMGTPDFAVSSLKALHEAEHEIVAVVTAPDKLGGRGRKQLIQSEVKKAALSLGLSVLQPNKLRSPAFLDQLFALQADVFVVVAFRMLPKVVWSIPPLGTLNVHASLLPKYRGAAPINWAIIQGEQETGVTTFLIEGDIDTGRILLQERTPIAKEDNFGSLYQRLKVMGADLLLKTLTLLERGSIHPKIQDEDAVTHAPKIFSSTCEIKPSMSSEVMLNLIRGLSPVPGAWRETEDGVFKLWAAQENVSLKESLYQHLPQGSLFTCNKRLWLRSLDGVIEINEIQPQNKRSMSAKEFLNGCSWLTKIDPEMD
jgi:methionyl-tRNA formyltransferase